MTTRVAVYCRISDDRRGDEAGVERQLDDARALATAKGWTIVAERQDNDISATNGATRPGYDAILAEATAGVFDRIVVWQTSRLWRNRRERAEGIERLARARVGIVAVKGTDIDLTTAGGRAMAGVQGEFDTWESEVKSERVVRALEQNAQAGRPHGRQAYGWTREYDPQTGRARDVIDPRQSAIVREIARRIIEGDSIRAITADLNDRGVRSPTGKPWGKQMVRHVVTRERNAGLRVHRGQVLGEAGWEAILDLSTYEQVRAVLADPTRRTSTGSAAAHLLSGIARCGVCGGSIRAGRNRTVESYRCADRSCVSRKRSDVDDLVTAVILGRLARDDAADLLAPDRSDERRQAAEEARGLRARLDTAADDYADGKIDSRQLERITAKLKPQIAAAEAQARMVDDSPLLEELVGNDKAAEVWDRMSLTARRAVVDLLVEVRILRTKPGTRTFDPESVEITWRERGPAS